ncbi:MAG TPA: hypothetical protein VH062_30535 [Polyangiaceae bacterium]|nr:hypothetical protein [Polyangiaceae bacterium]
MAVLAVALAVLVIGRPHAVVGVRLRGGPTEGVSALSLRLEVVERLGDRDRPLGGRHATMDVSRGDVQASWNGALDAEGANELVVAASGDGPVRARVRLDDDAVGEGSFSLTVEEWKRGARRRGGWVERRFDGGVVLGAAAERGVFAVPFASGLWVRASRDGNALPGLLDVHGDGADVHGPVATEGGAASPAAIIRRYVVTPREHAAVVVVKVPDTHAADVAPTMPELDVSLAVVPGALFAELRGTELVVRSPVLHERAYVAIVSETARIAGATVPLDPDPFGASGVLRDLHLPEGVPLWAVVSSEPELRSASLVGWPLRSTPPGDDPPTTFDVTDSLLLDTIPGAVTRELERERRVRLLAALIAAVALGGAAAAVAARASQSRTALTAHLATAGTDDETTTRVAATGTASVWNVVAAVLSVALAALLIALFASVAH